METLFVLAVGVIAVVFLYLNYKKSGGCDCGNDNCPSKKTNKDIS